MRRILGLVLLLAGAAGAGEPGWLFTFSNGDKVRGELVGIRGGQAYVVVPAATRAVTVPLPRIAKAEADPPVQADADTPPLPEQVLRLRDGGALLGHCRAIRQGRVEFAVETIGLVVVPPGDVMELLPAADAVRAYYRTVCEGSWSREPPLAPERYATLWLELGREDANRAFEAHRELVRAGPNAISLLADRLRVPPDATEVIERLVAALDDDAPEARLDAHRRLASLGRVAEPALVAASRAAASPEARQRIAVLLADLQGGDPEAGMDPEVRRFVRAIRVLEEIGSPEARATLEGLANGPDTAPTAREARLALERLRRLR